MGVSVKKFDLRATLMTKDVCKLCVPSVAYYGCNQPDTLIPEPRKSPKPYVIDPVKGTIKSTMVTDTY